jgi:Tol biopolymer transport system component
VLSPDGHKLAFILQREIGDLYYRSVSSKNPADLVVLDLTTGLVEPVPGLELAPGVDPTSITFSPDSGWLIATLPSDGAIDVYSWRSPLSKPLFTPRPDLWAWPGIRDQQVNPQ